MKIRVRFRQAFFCLVFIVCLLTVFSQESGFLRRASMESRNRGPQTSLLSPDLGIGANLNGTRPFPSNNAWNMDISRYPVHPNSANLIASIGNSTGLHPDFGTFWQGEPIGFPYEVVAGDQPRVPMDFIWWANQSDPGPYPFPPDAPVEGGSSSTGDRHVLVIDRDNWKLYETYSSYPQNGGTSWQAGNGAVWDLSSNKLRPAGWTSADAAGLPIFPGLVRRDEVVGQGEIHHALRFTAVTTRKSYIYPATHQAGSTTSTNAPPMGLRVRLKASKDISGFSPNVQVILRAMKKYGMILADNGSNWYVSGTHDPNWDDDELSALSQIKGSDFEVVNTPSRLVMPVSDFDGDGMSDVSVFRPSDSNWYALKSGGGFLVQNWGIAIDVPTPGDFDKDGRTDVAVFRPSNGNWYILNSSDSTFNVVQWGTNGDIPVAGDYDGDGMADKAVWRPSEGNWYILNSTGGFQVINWGIDTDRTVPGDYDGDGKTDIAVFRPSEGNWYILKSTGGFQVINWGIGSDRPVPGDYDGDGRDDIAVFRPSDGNWYILDSTGGFQVINWGIASDITAPGDYDGDGKTDIAIFRPSEGNWYILKSTGGFQVVNWGTSGDLPIPFGYIPR